MKTATACNALGPISLSRKTGRPPPIALFGFMMVLSAGLIQTSANAGTTRIDRCPFEIAMPGVYVISQDLICERTAITITASNVHLRLNGHTISGLVPLSGTTGIAVQNASRVIIENGVVTGFENGISFTSVTERTVRAITASGNGSDGIGLFSCSGNTVTGNSTDGNGYDGIGLAGGGSNTVTGNTTSGNGFAGLDLYVSSNNGVVGNTADQNGSVGIIVSFGAFGNTLARNTANQNGFAGINLTDGAVANTVADNTTTQNGDRGITLISASGNTVKRNTSDRNGASGIDIDGSSSGNIVAHNSTTANRDGGIRLLDFPSQNTVQDNTITGSFRGIWLGPGGTAGGAATQNTVEGNTITLNVLGIAIEQGSTGNAIKGNSALTNRDYDLGDQNPGCDSNAWTNNNFVTDNVTGESDGGPGAGCIQ